MNHTIRRQDRRISDEESIEILRKGEYGVLSICTSTNEAYGIPLSYVLVDREIYFHCATEGLKLDFLRLNNKVSFCVVGKTKVLPSSFSTIYESAIAFGTASFVGGDEKREGLRRLVDKYSGDFVKEGEATIDKSYLKVQVIKLTIESITGKARKL
jgi:uncharacterized protein